MMVAATNRDIWDKWDKTRRMVVELEVTQKGGNQEHEKDDKVGILFTLLSVVSPVVGGEVSEWDRLCWFDCMYWLINIAWGPI